MSSYERPSDDALPEELEQALIESNQALETELNGKLSVEAGLAAIVSHDTTAYDVPASAPRTASGAATRVLPLASRHESQNVHYIHFAAAKSRLAQQRFDSAPTADAAAYIRSALAGVRARLASVGVDQRDLDTAITEALADLGTSPIHDTAPPQSWRDPATVLPPAIPDMPGKDLRPDPGDTRTVAEFLDCLRNYRTWAGNPSYRVMARRCQHRFAASTICTALRGQTMPSLDMVLAIVTACGGSEVHQREFASAWRHLVLPDSRHACETQSDRSCADVG